MRADLVGFQVVQCSVFGNVRAFSTSNDSNFCVLMCRNPLLIRIYQIIYPYTSSNPFRASIVFSSQLAFGSQCSAVRHLFWHFKVTYFFPRDLTSSTIERFVISNFFSYWFTNTPGPWLVRFFRSGKNPHEPNPHHLCH